MRFEKGHVPATKGKGKKIDANKFMENFDLYLSGQINQSVFSKNVGLSVPTLRKHLRSLFENGYVDGVFFTDGEQVSLSFGGQREVRYPVL